ncbi:AAA family ATPase [Streptomyces sp. NPDC127092]|uniref:helix-turn-helix transcriptional regulator n=1 Tax=Streptomyces sp. NPDC127092 TaxID=3347135 RepID=UPI003648B109
MTTTIATVGNPPPVTVRTAELGRLERILGEALEGRSAVAELAADPGSGKSRLLTALARRAEHRGLRVLRSRCAEAADPVPHGPFIQAFSTWQDEPANGADAPPTDELLSLLARGPGQEKTAGSRCQYYADVRRLIGACVAGTPGGVLLVLDDYHWADAATAELVDILICRPVPAGLAVAVAYRPRQIPAAVRAPLHEGVEQGRVDLVELPALDTAQCAAVLRVDPDDPALPRLRDRAGGVPLYLLALAEEERRDDGTGSAAVPALNGFAVHLHAELAPLDEVALTVVRAAAVLGDTFTVDTVAEVAEVCRDRSCAVLGELRRRDLVRPGGQPGRLTFRHPLLRERLYEGIDACWRSWAHGRALHSMRASGVPATELAPHIERAGSGVGAADRRDLGTAARVALHLGRPAAAAHWLTVAIRLDRAAHAAEHTGGGHGGDRADRTEGGAAALEPVTEELWQSVVQHLAAAGDADRVVLLVREILTGPAARTDAAHRAGIVAHLSAVLAALGRDEEAQGLIAAELSAEPGPSPEAAAMLQLRRHVSKVLAGQVPARADVERLVRLTAGAGPVTGAGALTLRGLCAVVAGDTCAAERALEAAAQTLDELDDGPADEQESTLLLLLSWAEALMGWYGPAHGHAERALSAVRARGDTHLLAPLLDTLGYVHYQSGRMADALAAAQECRDVARAAGRSDHVGLSDAITAAAWAQLGRRNPAARRSPPKPGNPLESPRTPLNALLQAEACLAAGDGEAAFTLLLPRREAWRVSEPVAVLAARGYELLAAAAVTAGLKEVGMTTGVIEEWAAHSADAADAVGIAEQRGHALMARGHALLSRRQAADAVRVYEEAVELLGAESPAGARARELVRELDRLARTGAGRDADAGPEGAFADLTLREKEVAALAGEGCKTKDIALRLTVSPRTVDAHLTRIYSKLGVNSRAELARLMALAG